MTFEISNSLTEHVDDVLVLSALGLVSLEVNDDSVLLLDLSAETFDLSSADDDELLEFSDFFLELRNLTGSNAELVVLDGQALEGLVLLVEKSVKALDLLSQVGDLVVENVDLTVSILEFTDAESQFLVLFFQRGDLAAHEFDLLGEVHELLFEELLVTERHVEVAFSLGSLDGFIVEVAREFFDLLDEEQVVLFGFSELGFELLEADQEQVVFSASSLEFFNFLKTLVVGQTELFEFSLEVLDGQLELLLSGGSLLELDSELVDVEGELADLLILLLVGSLELLDGAEEIFDSCLKSVDFSFVLAESGIG